MSNKRKLQQMKDGSFFLTLPKSMVLAKSWAKGSVIKISISQSGDFVLSSGER